MEISQILYRIQEHPLLYNLKKSDVLSHIKTVIELIGVPALYEEKLIKLNILNYRAKLPKDFKNLIDVRTAVDGGEKMVLGNNQDNFKKFNSVTSNGETLLKYHVIDDYIYVDFIEGVIEIVYNAFKLDKEGLPILPDNESLFLAIENYIKSRHFGILADLYPAKYERAYQKAEQQYTRYIKQATASLLNLDPNEARAVGDMIIRLLPQVSQDKSSYKYSSNSEQTNDNIW